MYRCTYGVLVCLLFTSVTDARQPQFSSRLLDKAQKTADKQLEEARDAETKAANELAVAKHEAEAAAKRVAELQAKLDASRKLVAAKQAEAKRVAAARASALRMNRYRAMYSVRRGVDRDDSIERFAILAPGGPIVVEVSMTVDGKPFRHAREKIIDEMIAAADTDKDGKPTWKEALANVRFSRGQFNGENDENGDGLVDRDEVRWLLARVAQGPTFTLTGQQSVYATSDLKKILDADGDGALSSEEIAGADKRLKSRDTDDNDVLYAAEFNGGAAALRRQVGFRGYGQRTQFALMLGPTATAEKIHQALQVQYKDEAGNSAAGKFDASPEFFMKLDTNGDGLLSKDEAVQLNTIEPHAKIALDLGRKLDGKGLSVTSLRTGADKSSASPSAIAVELPQVNLTVSANLARPRTVDYTSTVNQYLNLWDKNSNGYLEKDEVTNNFAGRQFRLWDEDGDGKVYPKEIKAYFGRVQSSQSSQIRAIARTTGDPTFQVVDTNGDGRLSLREMRGAPARLKTFDKNSDGQIAADEVPTGITVSFALGGVNQFTQTRRPAAVDAPKWFTHMDRNSDGDVTLREFLGSSEDFRKLDTNNDGFLDAEEAKAATKS